MLVNICLKIFCLYPSCCGALKHHLDFVPESNKTAARFVYILWFCGSKHCHNLMCNCYAWSPTHTGILFSSAAGLS